MSVCLSDRSSDFLPALDLTWPHTRVPCCVPGQLMEGAPAAPLCPQLCCVHASEQGANPSGGGRRQARGTQCWCCHLQDPKSVTFGLEGPNVILPLELACQEHQQGWLGDGSHKGHCFLHVRLTAWTKSREQACVPTCASIS